LDNGDNVTLRLPLDNEDAVSGDAKTTLFLWIPRMLVIISSMLFSCPIGDLLMSKRKEE
jgi:hypothetical protein